MAKTSPQLATEKEQPTNESRTLGHNLKRLRTSLDLSLAEVATRAGLAHSSLWKVEAHQMSLTYDKLVQLANGLGVEVTELFAHGEGRNAPGRRALTRAGQGEVQRVDGCVYTYSCTELRGRAMTPMLVDLEAERHAHADWSRHEGEEYIFVVRGPVMFETEFYEPLRLETGDSLYYDGSMGHTFSAASDQGAQVLSVVSSAAPSVPPRLIPIAKPTFEVTA